MSGYWVICYRKVCQADRHALAAGHLNPKRFELVHEEDLDSARRVFDSFAAAAQVLAVELYGPVGLLDRRDLLLGLVAREASDAEYATAVQSAL